MDSTEDRGPEIIRAVVTCLVLSGLALVGRIVSRKLLKANFLVSDYLVAFGSLGAWLLSSLTIWGKYHLALTLLGHQIAIHGSAYPLQM